MLTSDKPIASTTWLDRLRLSKGLSTTNTEQDEEDASGTPLTLDDFLLRNHHHTDTDSPPTPSDPELTDSPKSDPNHGEWYGVMSDVLSDLFNFGVSSGKKKKVPRKQSNPKHCSLESPPPPKFATSAAEKRERKRRRSVVEESDDVEEEEEEEEGEKELVGFSRSEVTVIDTSFEIWKTEKVVFRRRNVWKVREKKGNYSRGVVSLKKKKKKKKKKRRCDVDDGEIGRKSKKMKLSDNNQQYSSEELHDDDLESSNANRTLLRRLPSKPRSVLHNISKKNNELESRGHRSSLA